MPPLIVPYNVQRHWPRQGIQWPVKEHANGKTLIDPLPIQISWRLQIQRAVDRHPGGPQNLQRKKKYIDRCFGELVLAATELCYNLAEKSLFELLEEVRPTVPWARSLSIPRITNLLTAILMGRGAWKLRGQGEGETLCFCARVMDIF